MKIDEQALLRVMSAVRAAEDRYGHEVTVVAATKTVEPDRVNHLLEAGIRHVGENRVQELVEKFSALSNDFCVHFIGQLQTNKVKYILDKVYMVQSVDRLSLARALDEGAARQNRRLPVLAQLDWSGQTGRGGVSPQELEPFLLELGRMPHLDLQGLMCVPPVLDEPEKTRAVFRRTRGLFEQLRQSPALAPHMKVLSMGMSADYPLALEEGATMIRLGSALFGHRV